MSRVSTPRRAAASLVSAAAAPLVVLALASPAASAGDCQNGRLDLLLGKPYSQEKARAVSKAFEIREMTEGRTAVTADYRSDRLNIVVDLKGNVRRADCG
jgi:Peptidase inhibitor I78 family